MTEAQGTQLLAAVQQLQDGMTQISGQLTVIGTAINWVFLALIVVIVFTGLSALWRS